MTVQITIKVRDVINPNADLFQELERVYQLDDLLMMPQAHVQLWNDIITMSEQAKGKQKE